MVNRKPGSCANFKFFYQSGGATLEVRRPFVLRQMLKPREAVTRLAGILRAALRLGDNLDVRENLDPR
jgi:hypothetical protein